MKSLITNEGKVILVNLKIYNELKRDYAKGAWTALVHVNGNSHIVILSENFL